MQHEPKIALFVDFDNIYLGLRETSREAAEAFATRPHDWLEWIEHGMPIGDVDHVAPRESRALIRQCYLNPDTFGRYRGYFTRAGFSVVDCPTLTSRGKNSSDIVMVMDILDALRHETRFDRFVILSADADFTPVLQRLRAHDRRTAVMVTGQAAPAYLASCDKLITDTMFLEHALEVVPAGEVPRAPLPPGEAPLSPAIRDPELLAAIARRVHEEASACGTLPASELPRILRDFKEFTPTSNWLGYYSLLGLTEAILVHQPELRITDDDPWRIAVRTADASVPATVDAELVAGGEPEAPGWDALRERVVRLVAQLVAESPEPLVMGRAADAALKALGLVLVESRWLGRGTFKALLTSVPELPFRVAASPLPGYLFDPERHAPPGGRAAADTLSGLAPELAELIRRMHELAGAPRLAPRQYAALFDALAGELARAPYTLMGTGKAVRDGCAQRGEPVARQAVTSVLRTLDAVGYPLAEPPHRPAALALAYRGGLLNALRAAQVVLSGDELHLLDAWLLTPCADVPAGPLPTDHPHPATEETHPDDVRSGYVRSAVPDAGPDLVDRSDSVRSERDAWDLPAAASFDLFGTPRLEAFAWPPRDALLFDSMDEAASRGLADAVDPPASSGIPSSASDRDRADGSDPEDAPHPPLASAPFDADERSMEARDEDAIPSGALGAGEAGDARPPTAESRSGDERADADLPIASWAPAEPSAVADAEAEAEDAAHSNDSGGAPEVREVFSPYWESMEPGTFARHPEDAPGDGGNRTHDPLPSPWAPVREHPWTRHEPAHAELRPAPEARIDAPPPAPPRESARRDAPAHPETLGQAPDERHRDAPHPPPWWQ